MKSFALRNLLRAASGAALILGLCFEGCVGHQEKENAANPEKPATPEKPVNSETASTLDKGAQFLAENKKKEGVKTTASGLQYKVLTEGSGKRPAATDTVVCNYRGTLISGTEFDSSYKRGQPAEFALNRVIPGWTEGVQLMKEGSKYEFFIPGNLAYGIRGAGDLIGPNETLIFEIELIRVK
jgi:FKBP-type peptidyl-prolyl cis-trans isomerase FkpA